MSEHQIRTDYELIRYQPGLYWTRGVIPFPSKDGDIERWSLVKVAKQCWTKESGKDHCQWLYMDHSGGKEIDSGEWIRVWDPNESFTPEDSKP